jgi:hypothetical protein
MTHTSSALNLTSSPCFRSTPVVLELGSLIAEDSSTEAWSLFTHCIPQLRERVLKPVWRCPVSARHPSLAPADYVVMIDDSTRARLGTLGMRYSPEPAERWHDVAAPEQLVEERDPRTHRPGSGWRPRRGARRR